MTRFGQLGEAADRFELIWIFVVNPDAATASPNNDRARLPNRYCS